MEFLIFAVVIAGLLFLFFLKGLYDERKYYKKIYERFKDEYKNPPVREYSGDEFKKISGLFYRKGLEHTIDDITAGDIEFERLFKRFNYCKSSCGDSVLYDALRTPGNELVKQDDFEEKIDFFMKNDKERISLKTYFFKIGRMNKSGFFDCIDYFDDVETQRPLKDIAAILLIVLGIALIFFNTTVGILVLVGASIFNIIMYYSERGTIEPYVLTFIYISNFILRGNELTRLNIPCLNKEFDEMDKLVSELKSFTKKARFVSSSARQTGTGNPLDIIADYGKMLLHIDIIEFYKMLDIIRDKKDLIERLYCLLGAVECYISIADLRLGFENICIPGDSCELCIIDGYHPLIENPVTNSISTDKGVLITGSNASGKSTFLKMVLVNILTAETIHTCFAKEYRGDFYSIFSSMSLRDDLSGKDSYFMVEIKAMKRILDYCKEYPEHKVVCFVDEVLRGTNTVERIASSTEILKYLAGENTLSFAATHDGELTFLLEKEYNNYHFDEEIKDDDVLFNYMLKPGRATSKNAIKLLSVMGFNDSIVEGATKRAMGFVEKGEWN